MFSKINPRMSIALHHVAASHDVTIQGPTGSVTTVRSRSASRPRATTSRGRSTARSVSASRTTAVVVQEAPCNSTQRSLPAHRGRTAARSASRSRSASVAPTRSRSGSASVSLRSGGSPISLQAVQDDATLKDSPQAKKGDSGHSNRNVSFQEDGDVVMEIADDGSAPVESDWEDVDDDAGSYRSVEEYFDENLVEESSFLGDIDAIAAANEALYDPQEEAAEETKSEGTLSLPDPDGPLFDEEELEEPHPFIDVLPYSDKIKWVFDDKLKRRPDYSALTNKEMKEILKSRGLPVSGSKLKLNARLVASDSALLKAAGSDEASLPFTGAQNAVSSPDPPPSTRRLPARRSARGRSYSRSRSRSCSGSPDNVDVSLPRSNAPNEPAPMDTAATNTPPVEDAPSTHAPVRGPPAPVPPAPNAQPPEATRQPTQASACDPPGGVHVEDASVSGSVQNMAVDPDAVEMFPSATLRGDELLARQTSLSQSSSPHDGRDKYSGDMNLTAEARAADKNVDSPGNTTYCSVARSVPPSLHTAATEPSSGVSSFTSQSQVSAPVSLTGRLLNTRPRRNTAVDGIANFLSVSIPASREPRADPSQTTHRGLDTAFSILHANDGNTVWYPIYDPEPGEAAIPPLTDPKKFPGTLDAFQVYGKVSNPWDLRKVRQGETDNRGNPRRQKTIYVTVLCGTKFSLDHVMEISTASLNAAGIFVRRKEVDALDTNTICMLVGLPNCWDSTSLAQILNKELPKHEEWMQGNVHHSYNAREHMGEVFPSLMVRIINPRLPEGKDVLTPEDNESINYLSSLRQVHAIEVCSVDKQRILGCLEDFRGRAKLTCISKDCDILRPLANNAGESLRRDHLRTIAANMNYQHSHSVKEFSGIVDLHSPARGELAPDADPSCRARKHTNLRREMLDVRRPDGGTVFCGVIQLSGSQSNCISAYHFNDDKTDAVVSNIVDLATFMYCYLVNVKQYSVRSAMSVLSAFDDQKRLLARDSTWDSETFRATSVNQTSQLDFVARMSDSGIAPGSATFLLPDLLKRGNEEKAIAEKRKKFSDEAMQRVAETMRFKNRPGLNPATGDNASVLTDRSGATDGAASHRSVTTADIQTRMPERRAELNALKDELEELSPGDIMFSDRLMQDSNVDTMSISSSASAMLAALYRDTLKCITKLKLRIAEVKQANSSPAPASTSGNGASPVSASEVDRGPRQGS